MDNFFLDDDLRNVIRNIVVEAMNNVVGLPINNKILHDIKLKIDYDIHHILDKGIYYKINIFISDNTNIIIVIDFEINKKTNTFVLKYDGLTGNGKAAFYDRAIEDDEINTM